jgi:tRNA nucleotidyltransferase (CCA-adding enzyme)
MAIQVSDLRYRMAALPGIGLLLPALEGLDPAYLVGGAVRDLLRGEGSVDLDVAVEGDAPHVARELAARLGGEALSHERFGTATVRAGDLVVDLAATRRERYERPGTLPLVEPAGLLEDLGRRDFTVNAMAADLSHSRLGELHDPHGGLADLDSRLLRVLHERSFLEDPTRMLRALRYEARLGFALEAVTEDLLREAAAARAPATVSGPRLRDELMDLLGEPDAPVAVARMRDLGVGAALDPALDLDPELVAGAALGSVESGASPALAGLAALCSAAASELEGFVERLGLPASDRDAVLRAARRAPALAEALRTSELPPSDLHALLDPEPAAALALALAMGAPADPVLRFLADLRGAELEITGDDLVAAGVPQSPAIGHALAETLRRKLDGELSGREEELRAALALAEEGG